MLLNRPVRKLRHLLSRFTEMERRIADLQERLGEVERLERAAHHLLDAQRAALKDHRELLESQRELILRHDAEALVKSAELRDTANLAARSLALGRRRRRVLFLVHLIEAWDSYHELVEAMRESDDFEPIVASIPRRFPGADSFSYEAEIHEQLNRRRVPHIRLPGSGAHALRLIKAVAPDLIFRQSQWDADVAEELSTDKLAFARLCLIPYETMNLVQNVPGLDTCNTAVDSRLHRAAAAVFCTNDLMLQMAQADGAFAGRQFRLTGHPKGDRIRSAAPRWPLASGSAASGRRRVVWSAHHSIGNDWTKFGMFPVTADEMLAWARTDVGTDFVFMPHPNLLPRLQLTDSPFGRGRLKAWLDRWEQLPNATVFVDGDYAPLLAASDLLITDGLSMLVEYQLLERPVIFLERRDHRPFTRIGDVVRTGTHPVGSVAEARCLAERFLRGEPDPLRAQQRVNGARLFGSEPSVPRILESLREMLDYETGRSHPGVRDSAKYHADRRGRSNSAVSIAAVMPS